jgi:RNA polymerase sigma-70 factor, ECF subfamily
MQKSNAACADSGTPTGLARRKKSAEALRFSDDATIENPHSAPPKASFVTECMRKVDAVALTESDLVIAAKSGRRGAFRVITERCNQHLFRIARSVLHDDCEAEEVLQEAYIRAFRKINSFRGDSTLLTWLSRITLNEARGRLRRRRLTVSLDGIGTAARNYTLSMSDAVTVDPNPEAEAARGEVRLLIEKAIDGLPEVFRVVFIMRDVDECTAEETAVALHLRQPTVNTRLHRARKLLRAALTAELSPMRSEAFPFLGSRCGRMTVDVLARLPAAIR